MTSPGQEKAIYIFMRGVRGLFYHCTAISAGVNHFWPCKHFWILQISIWFV